MRSQIKRAVMAGYCKGRLPAWFVRVVFSLFSLKGR